MKRRHRPTKTGRYFQERTPLAARSILLPPVAPELRRISSSRLCIYGPTDKLDMSSAEFAASIRPSVWQNAIFFLDTGIFSVCTCKALWDLFLSRQILISPMVFRELLPWIKDPHRNREIRDLVYASVQRQSALEQLASSESAAPGVVKVPGDARIEVRFPTELYEKHAYEYYFRLLSLRKIIGTVIAKAFEQNEGRPPSDDEFMARAHPLVGERGLQLAKKGLSGMDSPNMLSDEQTVVLGMLTAIIEGREVYIVTRDTDIPEQFGKLSLLVKEHYRAMNAALRYATQPEAMQFREVVVIDEPLVGTPWTGESILELRIPEREFNVLPPRFRPVIVHCILLGGDERAPKVSYSCFTAETNAADVLRIKAATGGLSTDRFDGRNCTIRTGPLTQEQHEVFVTIGKEKVVNVPGWGTFGMDDHRNVLTCCEEVTRFRPIQPLLIQLPVTAYLPEGTLFANFASARPNRNDGHILAGPGSRGFRDQ
jgi:hypothetical protein